ncbi:penicillin-binding protein 1A [Sphingomonas sp. Ag1]|jgi:penicillin-binding protein 1A|uniref:penicillin-binding protein 1A n=1 Tax=Sphingomonas sp. Ag1 TaxID=1642949 RepID=UPI000621DC07|nr:transglycosylase domain-containing protein [Sphingomonas sp. Ag1]KKI20119.1 penicillin-binding protein [Sphingomonas sp. Ag1]
MASDSPEPIKLASRGPGFRQTLSDLWQRRWFKALAVLAAIGLLLAGGGWWFITRDLPSVEQLRTYEPPLPTNVRAIDGSPIYSYARERRVELSFNEYPKMLVNAFLAAEDKTFFEHHGVDYPGLAGAVIDYVSKLGSGQRARGGSTITQQVAKNLLIGNEYSPTRKIREAILAWRIEDTLTKPQILELYLNQIFLGRNAYGVEAASHAYFDKELDQLNLAQMAYLAILPKGPANYDPIRDTERAISRRNWALGEMERNGFITAAQRAEAQAQPIGAIVTRVPKFERVGGYFVEEVRRELIDKFGETARDGANSVYSGGLWVRTSMDRGVQEAAAQALRDGLLRYDRGRGFSGPLRKVEIKGDRWQSALLNTNVTLDYNDWRPAIIISRDASAARIGFANGTEGVLPRAAAQMPVRGQATPAFGTLEPGDIIAVAPQGGQFALRSVPKISGGFVVQEPQSGRILAMQGGFDASLQSFNRATQAMRQPGSTIKPIVYAAALEHGMTPASIIVDGPFCVDQGARLGQKCFRNFGNSRGAGPRTMRWGVEQSRNLMTVRAAAQTGMANVVRLMKAMDIGDYQPYLSYALGAGETTVMKMVNAYGVLANQGRWHSPTLIDFVQNRRGQVIWPENWRACDRCNMPDWDGKPMPRPIARGKQVLDAMSAFQMVHIAEGVIQRGTATTLRDLNRPIFGKTGTNSGPKDVWFIGGTPQMVAGVYIGYDSPVNLGGYAQGGTLAAPIFKQWATKAYEGMEVLPFRAPQGIRMVRVDRASGRPVFGAWPSGNDPKPAVIWEAFKPQAEGRRAVRRTGGAPAVSASATAEAKKQASDSDFLQREGGIY